MVKEKSDRVISTGAAEQVTPLTLIGPPFPTCAARRTFKSAKETLLLAHTVTWRSEDKEIPRKQQVII